jgi:hypothetical protein
MKGPRHSVLNSSLQGASSSLGTSLVREEGKPRKESGRFRGEEY